MTVTHLLWSIFILSYYIFIFTCELKSKYIYITGVGSGEGGKGASAPHFFWLGDNDMFVPPLLTPHFHFPLELYVFITVTNNYLAFFIYQFIILWTISINWNRWLLVNNHISKYNSFILVLYRRYINYVSVCPPPHFLAPSYATVCVCVSVSTSGVGSWGRGYG